MKKYQKIASEIRERIFTNIYKLGEMLPYEYELCDEFGCSKDTMKKALAILVEEGLIIRRRGAGTFVKSNRNMADQQEVMYGHHIKGFTENFKTLGTPTSKVLDFKVIKASEIVAKNLEISTDDFVFEMQRIRFVDDIPHVIETFYMPINLIPGLNEKILEGSVYKYIENELGKKIQDSHQIIRAFPSTTVDQKLLLLTPQEPIVEIEKVAFLTDGTPFEFAYLRFHYAHFSFYARMDKV